MGARITGPVVNSEEFFLLRLQIIQMGASNQSMMSRGLHLQKRILESNSYLLPLASYISLAYGTQNLHEHTLSHISLVVPSWAAEKKLT
jgi:hypothetical protein